MEENTFGRLQFEKMEMRPASSPVAMNKVEFAECKGSVEGTDTVFMLEVCI